MNLNRRRPLAFRASCNRTSLVGPSKFQRVPVTCSETFDGVDAIPAFEAHMRDVHRATVAGAIVPKLYDGKPTPWKAPAVRTTLPPAGKRRDDFLAAMVVEADEAAA